jgi:RNA polymerase primary sigma factor
MRIGCDHLSLDAPLIQDDSAKFLDVVRSEEQELPDSCVMEISLQEEISQTLDTLSDRERDVIKLYFGIGGEAALTLEEIGERFNLTRERARQIKEKALWRLKHASRCKRLRVYSS